MTGLTDSENLQPVVSDKFKSQKTCNGVPSVSIETLVRPEHEFKVRLR
jgi:hypothetical protein